MQLFKNLYSFGERRLKLIRDFCMDLEPCFKVHTLVVFQINNIKLGQITNRNVIFYMVVSIINDKICNLTRSSLPAQPQSSL